MLGLTLLPATAPAVGTLLVLLATTALLLYLYATRHFGYWRRKGIRFIKPAPIAGNLLDVMLFRRHIGDVLHDVYNNLKEERFIGMYFFDQPVLFVKDLSVWREVLHKDFEYFYDRGFSPNKSDPIFWETLFSRKGKYWKDLRTKLSPAFTTGKLKKFFVLMEEKASCLDHIFDEAAKKGTAKDVAEVCGRYTTDVVASVGFGFESNSLSGEMDAFRDVLKDVFVYNKTGALRSVATFVDVPLLRYMGSKLVSGRLARFLRSAVWAKARQRQATGAVGRRGDFLDLIIELREKGSIADDDKVAAPNGQKAEAPAKNSLSMEGDIFVSQAFSILSAGHDTTATTLSFALYELARNQDVQERLRENIRTVLQENDDKLSYEALQSMNYLEMVVAETLRMYPILPFLDRTCTKAYRVPGTDVVIDKGVFMFTSLLGVQRDERYYPEPERFDPLRFTDAAKAARPTCAYMPFGDGPRMCIGMRLAHLQVKLGLVHLLLNYKMSPCEQTPLKMEYNLHSFLIQPRHGVPLTFTRL